MTDYCAYVKHVHNGTWKPSRFHKYLCDTVQDFLESETDRAIDILIISTPPQHGKSQTITETLPSWYLGRNPDHRVIEVSYNSDFAAKFGKKNRTKIEEFGKEIFGIQISPDTRAADNFEIAGHIGSMLSAGILAGVTGNSAELIIIDDPIKTSEEAMSETHREKCYQEWLSSIRSRAQSRTKVILIMTRWHEDDLAGRLIDNEKNVRVLNLPLEAEEHDLLGREIGDALCPEIGKDNVWLEDFKSAYLSKEGSRTWNALYQGHPTAAEGNMIRREWWKYYKRSDLSAIGMVDWLMSVDAAFKDGEDNDYVAIQIWGKREANMYLVDAVKKHLNMPDTIREIMRLRGMYPQCQTTLVEDKANGSAIIQYLRTHITGVIPINPQGGKVSRVNAVIGAIESGNVYLPDDAPFTGEFVEECAQFPNGKHDDQVDAMSQGLNRFIYYGAMPKPIHELTDIEKYFPKTLVKKKKIDKGDKIHVV